ncbi:class I SAM-dependent methyltransferase [Abyssisolibacter fermentans]|uniref:class I SAM-dependent methyltransferase n=1 Tax=Abyssisolibacter fermentans TaxID=1766203 RepID=UPI0008321036|nr:class I SAM-dependent methyltransferase [Abyssisolibacter fermentans]
MSDDIDKSRVHFINEQKINISKVRREGYILDIGGGGEGVIGQLYGEQVVAIDPLESELEEAPTTGALRIIMNAKDLKFLDNQFNTVTSFFTMMYISNEDIEKVFKEIYRVLKLDGEFLFWDLNIPAFTNTDKDIYAVPLKIHLEDKIIETGYGVQWKGREQNIDLYIELGKKIGFKVIEQKLNEQTYYIKFKK